MSGYTYCIPAPYDTLHPAHHPPPLLKKIHDCDVPVSASASAGLNESGMHRQYQTFVSLLKMQLFFSTAFCLAVSRLGTCIGGPWSWLCSGGSSRWLILCFPVPRPRRDRDVANHRAVRTILFSCWVPRHPPSCSCTSAHKVQCPITVTLERGNSEEFLSVD